MLTAAPRNGFSLELSGRIVDEKGVPLSNVTVSLPALQRHTLTDSSGHYLFRDLPPGVYAVECSAVGFAKEVATVDVRTALGTLDFTLHVSPFDLGKVTVTARPQPSDALSLPEPLASLDGRQLDRQRGQGVIQSIEELPGVAASSRGPLNMKPVIRGLTSYRVVVAEDGVRHQNQQWDDEESPEISALDVERIEVERGPNSVLYGSDALGGVVNIIRAGWDFGDVRAPMLGGKLLLNGFSNNRQAASELMLFGEVGTVGYRATVGGQSASDITTPAGKLDNSGAGEFNGRGVVGTKREWGNASVDYSHLNQEIRIHPDPEGPLADTRPIQKAQHDRLNAHLDFQLRGLRIELNNNWQRNERQLWETDTVDLVLDSYTFDARVHHRPIGHLYGTFGTTLTVQTNATLGSEPMIPAFRQVNFGSFLFEQFDLDNLSFSGGIRFDNRKLSVNQNEDLNVAAQTLRYTTVSGALGCVWRVFKPLGLAINVGRGWRSPTVEELFVSGVDVDEPPIRHVAGDPTLEPEASLSIDCSIRYVASKMTGELAVFNNRISRYIYLAPTGTKDSATGFDNYAHRQTNALLSGGEFRCQAQVIDWLLVNFGGDYVRGENEAISRPLPLIPAARLLCGARVIRSSVLKFTNVYLDLSTRTAVAQNRVDLLETGTPGYTLTHLGLGGEVQTGSGPIRIDLSADNLFNVAYRDHLSRYREYALDPGRNVSLKILVPFSVLD